MNVSFFPGLKVQTVWVIPSTSVIGSTPIENRLNDLHAALHAVHGGLYINTKQGQPRFREKLTADGVVAYLICFNTRTTKEEVLAVVQSLGFQFIPEVAQVLA